jgi:hypothetical protein
MATDQSVFVTVLSESKIIEKAMNMDIRAIEIMHAGVSGQFCASTSRLDKYLQDYGHGVPLWEARWFSKQQPSPDV